ncbi:MAG: TolC family protein [Acidiferrobacterales bacterium]|nr:TolC family protein [Acidiferrobacterales bacterium]
MWRQLISVAALIVPVLPGMVHSFDIPQEPLRLHDAIAYAQQTHPASRQLELDYELARDAHHQLESGSQLDARVLIVPQRADRAAMGMPNSEDDSYARLELSYPIFDSGLRRAATDHAATTRDLAERAVDLTIDQRRLSIMRHYFDVLLADLDYAVKNEKMTLAFLRFNRHREEMDLYQAHAEVDVLALETIYRDRFHVREQAAIERMVARRKLGMLMGSVDYVPRDLQQPDLSNYLEREVLDFDVMLEQVLAHSPEMIAAKLQVEKARQAVTVTEKRYQPSIRAKLEANEWAQETGSRNSASIGLQLELPLVSESRRSHERSKSMIDVERAQAGVVEVEHGLRTRVLRLWKTISLKRVDLAAASVRSDYRDQYMDRARALYELEEAADIGDAQAEQLRSLMELKSVEFELTLAWSEFDMLRGAPVYPE